MSYFVEVARYLELPLAELAKSKLESENIYCYLHSKYHIGVKWQIAQALGGVRLLVKSEDIEKAKCILNTDDSSLLENVKFPPIEKEDICHKCGSENLEYINLRRYSGALMMLTGLPIIFWGTYSKCKECGYKNRN